MKKDIKVIVCPILRETNGLAMSSRNLRLNEAEKSLASGLHKTLETMKENLSHEKFSVIKERAVLHLEKIGFKIEYLELAKSGNLEIINEFEESDNLIILIAAFLNEVRLIDNILINK